MTLKMSFMILRSVHLVLFAIGSVSALSANAPRVEAAGFTIGGQVYTDPDNPMLTGLVGVTMKVNGTNGNFIETTQENPLPGLWWIDNVPAGTYTVTPIMDGRCFERRNPTACGSITILVSQDNNQTNQNIQFLAKSAGTCCTDATYQLSTNVVDGHGNITPATGPQSANSVVQLTATPDTGYCVKAWVGTDDDTKKTNTNTVTMNGNKTVTVKFESCTCKPSYTIGGAIYTDLANPLTTGLASVTVQVARVGSGASPSPTVTDAGQGLWRIDGVCEGTYTVTPSKTGKCFVHIANGQSDGKASITINVNAANQAANQSIQFLAKEGSGCTPKEPDDSPAGATVIDTNGTLIAGQIGTGSDIDYYRFDAVAGHQYVISTGGTIDTYLHLYSSDGTTELASDDDGGTGQLSLISWIAPSTAVYYLMVQYYQNNGTGDYTITVSICGNGNCDSDETQCNCPDDCGSPPSMETSCSDGVDNDCDGKVDNEDPDCAVCEGCGCGFCGLGAMGAMTFTILGLLVMKISFIRQRL